MNSAFSCTRPIASLTIRRLKLDFCHFSTNYIKGFLRMASTTVQVKIAEGNLLGRVAKTARREIQYYSFQGIPYAQPPTGNLRFKPPVPVQPWAGTKEALKEAARAPATIMGTLTIEPESNEDCLHLNVYTKQLQSESGSVKRPVLLYIHGGGFMGGSGNSDFYGPDYLMSKDVVLVTINYRLGALGFLSLQNELCPGNNGLRDQVEALKWTQRNIAAFGGDPNNVTIFGESAGGASVQYLMLSPLSKGLFHRAITQSGSVLNPWAMPRRPVECAFALGAELGLKTTDSKALLEFLKTVPPNDLVLKSEKLLRKIEPEAYFLGSQVFMPVVEPNLPGAFLARHPIELIKEGGLHDVPYVLGVNTLEGPIMINAGQQIKEPKSKDEWERLLPIYPPVPRGTALADSVLEKIKKFYFKNGFTRESYADVLSWNYFLTGNDQVLLALGKLPNRKSKTYFYQFTYDGPLGFLKAILGYTDWKGTLHTDELPYLFWGSMIAPVVKPGTDEDKVIDIMTGLWTDFAKTGDPTPTTGVWKPYTAQKEEYLEINLNLSPKEKLNADEAKLWRSIFDELSNAAASKL